MIAKKRNASLLFALVAGCTVLALAAGPAFAGAESGKGQENKGQEKKNEQAATESASQSAGGDSTSKAESPKGKGASKKSGTGSTAGSGSATSQSSGQPESSANTPAPTGSTNGQPVHGCDQAQAGYTHNYASTCDGSPSLNGNGGGKATGKPCAGCVGAADNKNPKGQFPDGSDHNNGYECDGNKGIGKGNPAHTSCQPPSVSELPPTCPEGTVMVGGECVPPQLPCPEGTTMVGGVCVQTDTVLPDVTCPEGTEMVDGACVRPDEVQGEVIDKRAPRVLGGVLPFTGAPLLSLIGLALGLMGAGTVAVTARRSK